MPSQCHLLLLIEDLVKLIFFRRSQKQKFVYQVSAADRGIGLSGQNSGTIPKTYSF
jgi:hypothetical protein